MFILKNAWISIIRNKGRNILIGIIILIIATACTVTLAIKNTAKDLINSYESAYDKEVTISFNRGNMMKDFNMGEPGSRDKATEKFQNIASYSVEDVENYGNSEYILDYYYSYSIGLNGNNIEKASIEAGNAGEPFKGKENKGDFGGASSTDFTIMGYNSIEAMSEFVNGTYTMSKITDNAWNIAFDGNYAFINEELASYNDLSLNDVIKFEDDSGSVYKYEIIGIFKEKESEENTPMSMFSNSVNTIITNAVSVENITKQNDNIIGTVTPTFIINDYDDLSKIQDEFYEKGLDENFVLQTNEETVTGAVSSITNVNSFATTFLVIILIIGGLVLFVLNMINIRERKYEIGVLRTIGISKLKLTVQFVCELMIVSFVALSIGCCLGAISAKGISNSLLANEINSSNSKSEEINNNFGGNVFEIQKGNHGQNMPGRGIAVVQAYDSIDAVVDIVVLLELLGIGLSLVLVSSIASMVSIQRFSPLTILKERS